MTEKKKVVKVVIGGEEYTLRSDRTEEYTRRVAEYVDRALSDVQSLGNIVETHKAAILAALAVADELFQSRQSAQEMSHRLENLTMDVSRLLPPKKRSSRVSGSFASRPESA